MSAIMEAAKKLPKDRKASDVFRIKAGHFFDI
jgi:hypothetical protein